MIERENGEVEALFFRDNIKYYLKNYEELPLLFNRHKNIDLWVVLKQLINIKIFIAA